VTAGYKRAAASGSVVISSCHTKRPRRLGAGMCAPPGEAGSGCDGRDKESLAPRPGGQEEAWGTSRHGETLPRRSMRTAHRVALVTGANRGIGLEVCRQLAQHGYAVVLGSRDAAKGERAAAGPRSTGAPSGAGSST